MSNRINYYFGTATTLLLLTVWVAAVGCKGKPEKKKEINLWLAPKSKEIDTAVKGFYDKQLFVPDIIRLPHASGKAFIFVDKLESATAPLKAQEREAYYKTALTKMPEADIAAHQLAWDLQELQALQSADGGYGTVFTTIANRPSKDTSDYIIEIRRNNIEEYPLHSTFAYLKYNVNTHETWLADNSGYYVPLSSIRAIKK